MSAWRQPQVQLLAVLALLLASVVGWLATGVGSEPSWLPPATAPADAPSRAVEATPLPAAVDLGSLSNSWQTPLFSRDRKPDQPQRTVQPSADLGGLKLTGIVLAEGVRRALFKQADGRDLLLREGARLGSGWRLQRIENQAVQFELDGRSQRLQLPAPRLPDVSERARASPDAPARRTPPP